MSEEVTCKLTPQEIMEYTLELTSAYFASREVEASELQNVIEQMFQVVVKLSREAVSAGNKPILLPKVPVEESVHDEYIVCLEDGKRLQMLKRHLNTVYSMSIEEYKERWGLPADYPVVAPAYARRRSEIAKNTGLGNAGGRRKLRGAA